MDIFCNKSFPNAPPFPFQSSLRLRRLSFPVSSSSPLGSVSPRVTGVKVHKWPGGRAAAASLRGREIVADVCICYHGDLVCYCCFKRVEMFFIF